MARIVDETYIEDLCRWIKGCDEHYEISMSRVLTEVKEDLENMPEVVRCKDCKHRFTSWGELCCDIHDDECVEDDAFCSYGERKDDAKEQTSESL